MRKILVALVAVSFAMAVMLTGCDQKRFCAATFDEDEEVVFDSGTALRVENERGGIVTRETILPDEDLVVEESFPAGRNAAGSEANRTVSPSDGIEENLDDIIERQLGIVPSYTRAPRDISEYERAASDVHVAEADDPDEEIIEEILEEVVLKEEITGKIVLEEFEEEIGEEIENAKPVVLEASAAKTETTAVSTVVDAAASEARIAAIEYQKFMDIDAYDAEADKEQSAPATAALPDSIEPAPLANETVTQQDDLFLPPPLETKVAQMPDAEKKESLELPFAFPPAPVDTSFQTDSAATENSHSLSFEEFDDSSLEFFGSLSDSLFDEKEG